MAGDPVPRLRLVWKGVYMTRSKDIGNQAVEILRQALDSDPTNLDAANRYWYSLSSFNGNDVRSGHYAIKTYRGVALASQEGVIALARAYRELFENTGEAPRAELFDDELLQALQTHLADLAEPDHATVQWVLRSIRRRSFIGDDHA